MRVTVLGATGGTGRHLVTQALERGHQVDAVVRDPGHAALPANPRLTIYRGDVHDAASIAPESVVVSGLGVASKNEAGTLTAGARAVVLRHGELVVEAARDALAVMAKKKQSKGRARKTG